MYINIYEHLPKEAKKIRETVFIKEQGFDNEFDEIDSFAKHLVLFDGEIPIATCRFFKHESCEDYFIGRIAVIKEYRGGEQYRGIFAKSSRNKNKKYWRKKNSSTCAMQGKKIL